MQKSVPIPAGFWEQVAYYNLYHFAYFLHVARPKSFFLDIQQSALMKCILFDRLAFAKFLLQFSYFPKVLLKPQSFRRKSRPQVSRTEKCHVEMVQGHCNNRGHQM